MATFQISNKTTGQLYIPRPVGRMLSSGQIVLVDLPANYMDQIYPDVRQHPLRDLVNRGLITITSAHNIFTPTSIEVATTSMAVGISGFAITSFAPGVEVVEIGLSVVTPAFSASYTITPRSATLTDSENSAEKDVTTTPTSFISDETFLKTVNNQSVTFILSATDGFVVDSSVKSISWRPKVYFGIGATGGNTEVFIKALASYALQPSKAAVFSENPGVDEYIYYAYPDSYGSAIFTVNGFSGGFVLNATVPVTNNAITQNYKIYQSVQPNLGQTLVAVV